MSYLGTSYTEEQVRAIPNLYEKTQDMLVSGDVSPERRGQALMAARGRINSAMADPVDFVKKNIGSDILNDYIGSTTGTLKNSIEFLKSKGVSPQEINTIYQEVLPSVQSQVSYIEAQNAKRNNPLGDILPIISLGLTFFAPGIGGAIGSALTGTAATTVASQVIGAAVVQGVLAEAQGGDFLDGAILGAVTAGVAPVVANTVGTTVADIMADSAIKNVVANAVASSASSAVTAALTGGDVDQAALTGALAGGIGSAGRDIGTALGLDTTPFSEQTQMLAAQEQGLGTSGATGANVGTALGVTAAGGDATSALTNALIKTLDEQRRAEATPISENIGNQPVLAPTEAEIAAPVAQKTPALVTEPLDATISEPVEIAPPTPQEKLILDLISQELGLVEGGLQEGVAGTIPEDLGLQGGVAETIPNLDQETLDLITQLPVTEQNLALDLLGEPLTPEAVDITPVPEENLALDVLGQPLTSEAVDIEPIPQDPLLGLSAPAVGEGEQEAIDYQALEGLSDPFVGIGEQEAIDQSNLDALDALSSAEVGQGEQEAINYQALEELSDPSIGLGEQEAIDRQALEELALVDAGQGEQDVDFQTTPYIPDFYISTGRRRDFGPTVTTLGQALSAPFFPSTPVSGLTSYRGAGEIESQRTGKPRRDVWNESSLRLKDALGL